MYPASSAVGLTVEDLDQVFPFALLVDGAGVVRHLGPSLAKLVGGADLAGKPVFEAVRFKKPRLIDPGKLFQDVMGKRLTCDVPDSAGRGSVSLFGAAFNLRIDDARHVLLALSPGVNARLVVEDRGLRLSDFGPADGSADLLPLLAMQAEMLEDGRRKTARIEMARDEMARLANQDSLTGLPNRRALLHYLERMLPQQRLSVVHVDLDRFKSINDTYGHAAGDAALRHAATVLRSVFGDAAQCARLGGDEFIVVLEGLIPIPELQQRADRTIAAMSLPFSFAGKELVVGASVGLAQSETEENLSADELLHRADLALYEIKRSGRGKALFCTPELLVAHSDFQALYADIRRGIADKEFEAFLQPQVNMSTGQLIGFEALARWNHPSRGLLAPAAFLGAVERGGLIREFDAEVRRSALTAMAQWDAAGLALPKLCLNVTVRDLLDPTFGEQLCWALDGHGLDPSRITLEIVESVLFDESTAGVLEACQLLVDRGFCLALDDFGTGHASLLSLVKLPVSMVKVDRAFVLGVSKDAQKRNLAQSIIDMTFSLNLMPLAEGVEDATDLATLQAMGCHLVQGYHIGRPMKQADALVWMQDWLGIPPLRRSS